MSETTAKGLEWLSTMSRSSAFSRLRRCNSERRYALQLRRMLREQPFEFQTMKACRAATAPGPDLPGRADCSRRAALVQQAPREARRNPRRERISIDHDTAFEALGPQRTMPARTTGGLGRQPGSRQRRRYRNLAYSEQNAEARPLATAAICIPRTRWGHDPLVPEEGTTDIGDAAHTIMSASAPSLGYIDAEVAVSGWPWWDIRGIGNHLRHAHDRLDASGRPFTRMLAGHYPSGYPVRATMKSMRKAWERIRDALEGNMRQQITKLGFLFSVTVAVVGLGAFVSGNNLLFLLLAALLATLLISGF